MYKEETIGKEVTMINLNMTKNQANFILLLVIAVSLVSLLLTFVLYRRIKRVQIKNKQVETLAEYIRAGAKAFLFREYKIIIPFVGIVALILVVLGFLPGMKDVAGIGWQAALCFVVGALFSGLMGFFGMLSATRANARTTTKAEEEGMSGALRVAFTGGAVLGLIVVGLGLLGASVLFLVAYHLTDNLGQTAQIITGYGLGASLIALFARVGGGIYTKAADVGADLVGKVEVGIPEDDPRNPAVIADNVGDNVGDIAGMGSDLAESYIGSIISTISLAVYGVAFNGANDLSFAMFPIIIAMIGIVASIISVFIVRARAWKNPSRALNFATYLASALVLVGALALSLGMIGSVRPFVAIFAGLVVGLAIGQTAEVFTSSEYRQVRRIVEQSNSGHATNIIAGIGSGMKSTIVTMAFIVIGIIVGYTALGVYGVALAAVGMLSTVGITISVDGYGPIADNAGGLAQMAGLDPAVRHITDHLDAVGNTTAAVGKGFSIGSAALTALALLFAFMSAAQLKPGDVDLFEYKVVIGILFGATLPFFFAALTMNSVGRAANKMIGEVRRQFREDKGIMEGTSTPDYARCIDISTIAALKEIVIPGLIAVLSPILAGLLLGRGGLAGLLIGGLASSTLLGIFMANAGGAWDNAKKYVEEEHEGCSGKGSEQHKAAVTGDTVGDPFKDTSGPSLNILIKLMSIIALIIAPILVNITPWLDKIIELFGL